MLKKIGFVGAVIFVLLCISAYHKDTEQFYTTVSLEDDMRLLDSHIIIQSGVSPAAVEEMNKEIQNLPTKLWKQYLLNYGTITLTTEKHRGADGTIVGSFNILANSGMEIVINDKYISYSLCHEFTHYLYFTDKLKEKDSYQEIIQEKDSLWKDLMLSNDYFYSNAEYFAEVGKLYFKGCIDAERYPYTVKFFDDAVAKYE